MYSQRYEKIPIGSDFGLARDRQAIISTGDGIIYH